jgi:hypothetical protein
MVSPKTRIQEKLDDLNELLNCYVYPTKGETLAAQKGLMLGWLSRLASTDYIVAQELEARLHSARQKNSSSKDTL